MLRKGSFVLWFDDVDKEDIGLVGEGGVKIGEIVRAGFPVANGFILSSDAYFTFIRENKLINKINDLLSTAHFERPDSLMQISGHIKKLIMHGRMSEELVKEIYFAYRKMSGVFRDAWVEVCASPTNGTHSLLKVASNVLICKGEANLILKIREGWASLFEPQAIIHRHGKSLDHFRGGMAMVVQKMVMPDRSGVIFTIDPIANNKQKIVIESIYGLVGLLAGGRVNPDRVEVRKTDLEIISKAIGKQTVLLKKVGLADKEVRVSVRMAEKQKLTHKQILDLAMLGKSIEQHYYFPQEIEWAIEKNKIYIVRTKPIGEKGSGGNYFYLLDSPQGYYALRAVARVRGNDKGEGGNDKGGDELAMTGSLKPSERLQLVLKGSAASGGIATGPVRVVRSAKDITKVHAGDILVCEQTSRDYFAGIKRAGAVVTDYGGGASHGSIVSRSLGIPAVVGTGSATKILKEGLIVTVNGLKGEIYKGSFGVPSIHTNLRTATKVYVDLAHPGLACKVATENVDGVGLLRGEVMMSEGKGGIYVNKLSEQIASLCMEFAPRPVVYRLSDFETTGSNPMLGYHGSFRHIQDPEAFKIEIEAVKTARQQDGCKNLWMMIPFCRSVKELIEIKRIMALSGLRRSPTFKLWMMVEVPSNVILLEEFIEEGIDGVLIGIDNLSTLLLGIDRGDSEVSRSFDTMNPAVLWAIERTIKICHKHGISSSVGGQGAGMNPDLLEKMIEWGIGSVSVTSDVTKSVRETIFEIERRLIEKRHNGKN